MTYIDSYDPMSAGKLLKLHLKNDDGSTIEIRRVEAYFLFHQTFDAVTEKLKFIFPQLKYEKYTLSYIDDEGDEIKIESGEELSIAIRKTKISKNGTIYFCVKLNQNEKNKPCFQKEAIIHNNIICDGCNNTISGFQYICMKCEDFNLCSQCATLDFHPEHFMLRVLQSLDWSLHTSRSFLNHINHFLDNTLVSDNNTTSNSTDKSV